MSGVPSRRLIAELGVGVVLMAGLSGCEGRRAAAPPSEAEEVASIEAVLRSADEVLASVEEVAREDG